jgi:succinate-semialdehyde dehydrogenase/glutarate-semialdehyde dehydrogenase
LSLQSINPATGQVIQVHEQASDARVQDLVGATARAARTWAGATFSDRARVLRQAARLLRERASVLDRMMAAEMGKPLPQGRAEVEKCAWVCEYFAENAERFLEPEDVAMDGSRASVVMRPLGVVLAIMPWNFPFWQVFRFAAPTLMAGNAALLKHAPSVQGCATAIDEMLRDAGAPDGVFRNLPIDVRQTHAVIQHPDVRAVTLTGSVAAGRAVASAAGAALKKCVLELGGSDAYIVLADADVRMAAETCVASRLINGGQSCIAAKRFIVVEPLVGAFTSHVVALMQRKTVGDPLAAKPVDLGPLARVDLRDALHQQVERSVAAGARLLLGGTLPPGPGAFYPPTLLADVRKAMPAYAEETFGPVAAILPARSDEDALDIANDTPFGLGAALFTRDVERGRKLAAERLDVGSVFVNDFVRSDPRLPFGGIKDSGFGRELSHWGIREFVNVKTIVSRD